MEVTLSEFCKLSEPDRLIFIARINHAIWYDQKIYNEVKRMLDRTEEDLPEAQYFPPNTPHNQEL